MSDDGLLNQSDVRLVISHWIDESSLKISDADLDKLAMTLFNAADVENSGTVTFDKFMAHLEKQPAVLANLNIGYVSAVFTYRRYAECLAMYMCNADFIP